MYRLLPLGISVVLQTSGEITHSDISRIPDRHRCVGLLQSCQQSVRVTVPIVSKFVNRSAVDRFFQILSVSPGR